LARRRVVFTLTPNIDPNIVKNNLVTVQKLKANYETRRAEIEKIDVGFDIAAQEEILANIRRLNIHIEKDIKHEERILAELSAKIQKK